MYGIECRKKKDKGRCADKRCIYPTICPSLNVNHKFNNSLLSRIRKMDGIRRVFIASGIRYDLIMEDKKFGKQYLENLVRFFISGQLKIAPEHCSQQVLDAMGGKPPHENVLKEFVAEFNKETKKHGKKQFLTYYMIAAHPGGCELKHMEDLKRFASKELKISLNRCRFTLRCRLHIQLSCTTQVETLSLISLSLWSVTPPQRSNRKRF